MVNVKVFDMRIRLIAALCLVFSTSVPAQAAPIYTFPVPDCTVKYARSHHDYPATDILGKKGCKFVAVIGGVVDEVRKKDTYNYKKPTGDTKGGIFVSIIGDDGVRYYGSHLQKVAPGIDVGVRVETGTLIGYLGDSGDARGTAPHIHFGISWPTEANIWWVRRGEIYPWKYLDAWKAGKDLSPAKAVEKLKSQKGEVPPIPKK
jgi:murein DD-endopeptidase MepM/ murein hydrolase activator NlpD